MSDSDSQNTLYSINRKNSIEKNFYYDFLLNVFHERKRYDQGQIIKMTIFVFIHDFSLKTKTV